MPRILGDLDELVAKISQLARSEAERTESKAQEEAEQIRRQAQEQAERERQEILQETEQKADRLRRQRTVETARKQREDYLRARDEALSRVWQEAHRRLEALVDDRQRYAEVLERLARMAAGILEVEEVILASDGKGQKLLTKERLKEWSKQASEELDAKVRYEAASEAVETWGGLIATAKEGKRRVDATFPTRLALARDEVREQVFMRMTQS